MPKSAFSGNPIQLTDKKRLTDSSVSMYVEKESPSWIICNEAKVLLELGQFLVPAYERFMLTTLYDLLE
jgi:hypothetical protein